LNQYSGLRERGETYILLAIWTYCRDECDRSRSLSDQYDSLLDMDY